MLKLKEKYKTEVIPEMMKKFGYKNAMAVPRIEKVVVNTGFGRLVAGKPSKEQEKFLGGILNDLVLITGRKYILAKSKKSIASFKIRKGIAIGAQVTLRQRGMYDFLERLINVVLPRSRDFQGIEQKSFDKSGNLTIGIKEQITFPEVSPEKSKSLFGLEITVVTNAKNREEGIRLLRLVGFPIKQ